MIQALIVDDEELGRINLRYALAEHRAWTVVGEAASLAAASTAIAAHSVDVVFLDIQMAGESGLTLARTLAAQAEPPLVIFVTAHDRFAVEAFEVHALDYLLKPIHDGRLAQALVRAEAMLAARQRSAYGVALRGYIGQASEPQPYWQQLSVRSVGRIDCVQLADVHWIEASGNYVHLHTGQGGIMHRITLTRLLDHLDPSAFLRVHRGAIVRIDHAAALEVVGDGVYRLLLRSGAVAPVSEAYVAQLRAAIGAR